jgi:hypothetical protein
MSDSSVVYSGFWTHNDQVHTIPDHTLSITCGVCKHHAMLEVANLILAVGPDTTAHDVRQKFRC